MKTGQALSAVTIADCLSRSYLARFPGMHKGYRRYRRQGARNSSASRQPVGTVFPAMEELVRTSV